MSDDEIEVTPEMIEAGATELAGYFPEGDSVETTVTTIFTAMWRAYLRGLRKVDAAVHQSRAMRSL
jgi:hypothetical protein